jgi:type IV pilus assembly protein PilP
MGDLEQYASSVKARPAAPIEPIPAIKPYVRFTYPGHELDPFDPKILAPAAKAGNGLAPDPKRPPEFLESFPLDGLRMVGTVYQDKDLWALIRIPDGAVQRVHASNYMGKNQGKVTKVEDTRVFLQELVEDGFGGYKEQENSIELTALDKKAK